MLETVEYVYQCWETTYWSRFAWRLLCLLYPYGTRNSIELVGHEFYRVVGFQIGGLVGN